MHIAHFITSCRRSSPLPRATVSGICFSENWKKHVNRAKNNKKWRDAKTILEVKISLNHWIVKSNENGGLSKQFEEVSTTWRVISWHSVFSFLPFFRLFHFSLDLLWFDGGNLRMLSQFASCKNDITSDSHWMRTRSLNLGLKSRPRGNLFSLRTISYVDFQ